jgi:SAM-dependent methyltransferase
MSLEAFHLFRDLLFERAAMFKKNFLAVEAEFGEGWREDFDLHLRKLLGLDRGLYIHAIEGYASFAIEFLRLQRLFRRKRAYEDVTYMEACATVYGNRDRMLDSYLPGTFLSHFLWRHHYRQLQRYRESFLPRLDALEDPRFYEVGTGTGFYTVQVLRQNEEIRGTGIDISPYSREITRRHAEGWGFGDRLTLLDLDITAADLEPLPCIQCVEVLEHLTDPQGFLRHLRRLLREGGWGFLTAALTAPHWDHIYLYWTPEEVREQIENAGFSVHETIVEAAQVEGADELTPRVAAFIVS